MVPCVIFEDEHLLAVNKPAGWNTHAPSPYAGEGIYDWLKAREPRWASLAILHRLDKETSGVMVFGKTPAANRSLTEQFATRRVRKQYLLLTDRTIPQPAFTAQSTLLNRLTCRNGHRRAIAGLRQIEMRGRAQEASALRHADEGLQAQKIDAHVKSRHWPRYPRLPQHRPRDGSRWSCNWPARTGPWKSWSCQPGTAWEQRAKGGGGGLCACRVLPAVAKGMALGAP